MSREISHSFPPSAIVWIQNAAELGRYDIRGMGAKRKLPNFDDLTFLTASMSRYPLEGYREACSTKTVLGTRFAKKPIELEIPITIAGMSFGALSATAKAALGKGASMMGTSTTTGDGGMTAEEREHSSILVYQCLPSRYGFNPEDLQKCEAIEVVVGQGAKPGGGGILMGQKVAERVAEMRTLPAGIDQRSPCRHPDWTGPDDLVIKIQELRELTRHEKPIYVKIGATRVYHDVKLCCHAGADVIVLDGMQGGTAASQDCFIEHTGIPTLAALRGAVEALEDLGLHRKVQLIVSGGIRTGADVAKALALGADAVSVGQAPMIAMGCNRDEPAWREEYADLGTRAGFCHRCETGRCPAGITTQSPELEARLELETASTQVRNYLKTLAMETQLLARACGKNDIHHLEREDLAALTLEAAAMAKIPLAGTDWYPGK